MSPSLRASHLKLGNLNTRATIANGGRDDARNDVGNDPFHSLTTRQARSIEGEKSLDVYTFEGELKA
jgi:hypothetical protein